MRIPLGRDRCLVVELRARCRHQVLGICPRCHPSEVRTLRNLKLALALAWLERLSAPDPYISNVDQVRRIARDAVHQVADLSHP